MGMKPALLALALLQAANAWGADECQLHLSEPRVDFGQMNRALALTPATERSLGERRLGLTLNCPNPTDMSLFYRAMAADLERFAFTPRGSYSLQVSDALLDGQGVELGLLAGSGQPPVQTATSLRWRPEHGIVPLRAGVAAGGRSLSVQIQISAWASEAASQVNDAVTWDTQGVFDAINAGRSRELRLQARFAPAACTPSLSGGGTVDFGKLSVMDLNMDKETALPARPLIVSVACDAPSAFTLRLGDNRLGSATGPADDTLFGLGLDARQNRIGRYRLIFDPTRTTADSWPQLYHRLGHGHLGLEQRQRPSLGDRRQPLPGFQHQRRQYQRPRADQTTQRHCEPGSGDRTAGFPGPGQRGAAGWRGHPRTSLPLGAPP